MHYDDERENELDSKLMSIWSDPKKAPKDEIILADVGWPYPVMCHWCEHSEAWAISLLNANPVNGKSEIYFETDVEPTKNMRGWMKMPTTVGNE